MTQVRITHVISSLDIGGAEMVLTRLVLASDRRRFAHRVVSLMDLGPLAEPLRNAGIPLVALGMRDSWGAKVLALPRLLGVLRQGSDLVQTWMYHSNLLGGAAAALAGLPVVWCVRQVDLDNRIPRSTRAFAWLGGAVSGRVPARIVYNAASGRESHRQAGYADAWACVIPNGFDLDRFHRDPDARVAMRTELGIADSAPVVGLIGRFDPQKDHRTFFAAAALVARERPEVRFVLAGPGVEAGNPTLSAMIAEHGLAAACHLLGARSDVPRLLNAFDVACLSSRGEGLPNTIGEAMACEVPCAATMVGDAAALIGAYGRLAPPRNPTELARALVALLALPPTQRAELGRAARAHIQANFSLQSAVAAYEQLWSDVVAERRR